jgi:type I restriction-modification system DNA methylase subunit
MSLVQQGIERGLIRFDEEEKFITYIHQDKRRNYSNPEEQVQAETFLKLILTYGYSPERVRQFVPVQIGSDTREADIIVYGNDERTEARIVAECKRADVSEREFEQAVSQAFSYAATGTVRAEYFLVTSGIKDEYFQIPAEEPKKYFSVPDIPNCGATGLAQFKYAKGGGMVNGQKLFELVKVTEDELIRRFKQAHDALWGGGALSPAEAFDEMDKLIFCKIWDERKLRKNGQPYDFQIFRQKQERGERKAEVEKRINKELFERITALYEEGRTRDPEVFKDSIRLTPEKLRTVVGYLEGVHLSETDLDSKGKAFETFLDSFFRGDFGQYFTPRPIVRFIVEVLPIKHDSLVLDTSCGSGGFLLHALDKVRRQADDWFPAFRTDPQAAKEHFQHWHDFAEKNLYGIEINEQIARTAKMNMILHDDGHTNVIAADGLLPVKDVIDPEDKDRSVIQRGLYARTRNTGFAWGRFDFIITNPPFGSNVKRSEQAYMRLFSFARKDADWLSPGSPSARDQQSTEILFLEQCWNYLREGGWLAIVIPDGILTNSSLQYVRDGIEELYRIGAVVSLPQTAFQATGAGVKSSVLFLKKHSAAMTGRIRQQKADLQERIKEESNYAGELRRLDSAKKKRIKSLKGFANPDNLTGRALTASDAYKEWKKEVSAEFKEQADALKESLNEQYLERKRQTLDDYSVFMAIAEDIGYDATGKPTGGNELEMIGKELARFIEAADRGQA